MKVITAIEDYVVKPDDIKVFMAGGITKCRDWQKEMIDILNQYSLPEVFDNVVLFYVPLQGRIIFLTPTEYAAAIFQTGVL